MLTMRGFMASALLLAASIVCLILMVREAVPEPVQKTEEKTVQDPLIGMSFTSAVRISNLQKMGFDSDLSRVISARIQSIQKKDTRNKEGRSRLLDAIVANADAGFVLCPSTELPQRYAAMAFLVSEVDGLHQVVDRQALRVGLEQQEWFDRDAVTDVYVKLEKTENRLSDATAIGISAFLLNGEQDLLLDDGFWKVGGFLGSVSLAAILRKYPEVEPKLVEYFALMHYMTELANDPNGQKFCGGGASTSDGGT